MDEISGAQRDILGATTVEQVREWLASHVRDHLGSGIDAILFTDGVVGAVFGLRLSDGREVVLKALRSGAKSSGCRPSSGRRTPWPRQASAAPGSSTDRRRLGGVLAIVEERLTCTSTGSPHEAKVGAAMAAALAAQIDTLRAMDGTGLVPGRPAWADWSGGAWPVPHHPAFDFSTAVPGFEWVDETADAAAEILRAADDTPRVIGHTDWVWQNVCIIDGVFVAGYDWDSLAYAPEPAIVGLNAGAFTQGSPVPPDAPTAAEVTAFLDDYETLPGVLPGRATDSRGRRHLGALLQRALRARPPPPRPQTASRIIHRDARGRRKPVDGYVACRRHVLGRARWSPAETAPSRSWAGRH